MNNAIKYDYLTSLRGLAAIWVVFYHISQYLDYYMASWLIVWISKGHLAVDFFFLLSGFIITLNYERMFVSFKASNYLSFLIKRVARIYPLHLFVLVAYLIIPLAYFITDKAMPDGGKYSLINYLYQLLLVNNWGLGNTLSWNVPAWSISTEWAAYLLFPFCVYILTKLKVSLAPFFILFLCVVIYCCFSFLGYTSLGENIQGLGLFRCLIEFLMGGIICKYSQKYSLNKGHSYFLLLLATALMGLIIYSVISEIVFAPFVMALSLFGFLNLYSSKLATVLRAKPLMLLGEISYSIYLVHFLVRDLFKLFLLKTDIAEPWWLLSYVLTVLILSFITYKMIETPARRKIASLVIPPPPCVYAKGSKAND
ncbi:acyltransferase family protein [Colwellia piezophila]|uniref:acyltransferase family protein n=1 Tax=Colwellia piezophila TaxID=211668 RepID=UPI0003734340|nr:acyltransferase [Colwellia piezophila]